MQNLLSLHAGLLSDQAEFESNPTPDQECALSTFESKKFGDQIYMILQLLQTSFGQINDSRVQQIKEAMIKNPLFQKMVSLLDKLLIIINCYNREIVINNVFMNNV